MPGKGHIEHTPTGRNLMGIIVERRQPYQVFWDDKIIAFAKNKTDAQRLLADEAVRQRRNEATKARMSRAS